MKVTSCTADKTLANAGNEERVDMETEESSVPADTIEKSDDVLNSDEASQSDELVWFDKYAASLYYLLEKVLPRLPVIRLTE